MTMFGRFVISVGLILIGTLGSARGETISLPQFSLKGEGRVLSRGGVSPLELRTWVDLGLMERLGEVGTNWSSDVGGQMLLLLDSSKFTHGDRPDLTDVVPLFSSYLGLKGETESHLLSLSGGRGFIPFGFGSTERGAFLDFPVMSNLSAQPGIGAVTYTTLSYENKGLGMTLDGSTFSPERKGAYLHAPYGSGSIRVRKGIELGEANDLELMVSYALKTRYAVGSSWAFHLARDSKLAFLTELIGDAEEERLGWTAQLSLKDLESILALRYSELRGTNEVRQEVAFHPESQIGFLQGKGIRTSLFAETVAEWIRTTEVREVTTDVGILGGIQVRF